MMLVEQKAYCHVASAFFDNVCIVANWTDTQAEKKNNVPNVKCVFW